MDNDELAQSVQNEVFDEIEQEMKREAEYMVDISGRSGLGKSKAHVVVRSYELFSNGDQRDIATYEYTKPVVKVFRQLGFTHVWLDFESKEDMDLAMTYQTIDQFCRPSNSVSWLPEEEESGVYIDEDGVERDIYYPMLQISLIPIGKETEYQMHGFNPFYFGLEPGNLQGTPCVLHFVFMNEYFNVNTEKVEFSMNELQKEVEMELSQEAANGGSY